MKTFVILFAALLAVAGAALGQGDSAVSSVQKTLKDQGFYYGEVTGKKDADTTAAIRRYQIRNGLQITGDLNAETQKSLGVKQSGATPGAITPPRPAIARVTPTAAPRQSLPATQPVRPVSPQRELMNEDEDDPAALEEPAVSRDPRYRSAPEQQPPAGYAPGPRGLAPAVSGVFEGTPFEGAPLDVQRRAVVGAQTLLMRQGFYRSGIDGLYGPGMEFAVRAFQSRSGIHSTGRLDLETLGALGLLPGQQTRRYNAPRQRVWRQRAYVEPGGERVYIPR